jgi:EH_Signature domain
LKTFRDGIRLISVPLPPARAPVALAFVQMASDRIVFEGKTEGFRPDKDYDQIARDVRSALQAGQTLGSRQLADSVWCLWTTTPALATEPSLLHSLLNQIETLAKVRVIRALAASFLQSFHAALPGLSMVSSILAKLAHMARSPYDNLQSKFRAFETVEGPKRLGQEAVLQQISIPTLLGRLGLGAQTSMGGFAAFCTGQSLKESETARGLTGALRLKLVRMLSEDVNGKVAFEATKPSIANALLRPYATQEPTKVEKDAVLDYLSAIIGDPRLNPARWTSMPEAREIALRWYTEQSLRQFLDIVDRVADPGMWRYRRRFWESIHAKGMIDSAWVVFDSSGADLAQHTFGKQIRFGRFDGSVQKGHAVLMLSIGGSLVAEWSHNGRCHIWNDGNQGPRMFQSYYSPESLRASGSGNLDTQSRFSQVHDGSESYSWQGKVANRIHNITGVRIRPVEYKV